MGIFDKLFKPNIKEMKAKRDVDGLVKAIKHRDMDVRLGAIFELGEIGDRRAVEPLCEVVSDQKPSYARGAACIALGKIGDTRAVKPLISFVKLGSEDPKYATEALAKIGEPSVEPLIEALPTCWKKAKQRIAEALGEIGDKRAVEPLIKFLGYSGLYVGHMDDEGRRSIVRALRRIGDERCIAGLEMASTRDSSPIVRVAANEALREVRAGAHTREMKVEKDVEGLIKALKDEDSYVREYAAIALGELKDKRAVEPLIQALKDEQAHHADSDAQRGAAWALGELGDARAVKTLIQILNRPRSLIRETAKEALEKIKSKKS